MALGGAKRRVHRGFVDHAVGQDGRRAGGREGLEDRGREPLCDGRIRPRAFRRERDPVEPGQQVEGEAQPGIGQLGQVRVRVDHPGEHDPRPQVDGSGDHLGRGVRGGAHVGEPAGLVDHQQAVGLMTGPAGRQRRQDASADRERGRLRQIHGDRLAGRASADGKAASAPRGRVQPKAPVSKGASAPGGA